MGMNLGLVSHRTLHDQVAGRLAALVLDGPLPPGHQLPPERELMARLGVSRPTLREALQALAELELLEARPGVGWFVIQPSPARLPALRELARGQSSPSESPTEPPSSPASPPPGPRRLAVVSEKPLHIPNLQTDRLGTFDLISWWERERVRSAKVLVVGAGALGNEVIKNLTLMGVGHIFLVDFDEVEAANLSRSVFFRESDTGRPKAEVVAARAKTLNPDVHLQYLQGDVTAQLGLGVVRRMDVVISCLDNREARLAVNRFCYWMGKPMVDGAIQELLGLVRVRPRPGRVLRMHPDGAGAPRDVAALFLPAAGSPEHPPREGPDDADDLVHRRRAAGPGSPQAAARPPGRGRQGAARQRHDQRDSHDGLLAARRLREPLELRPGR
jgi:DNA-binding transcriptional regulator YhcF (GntR family)